MPTPDLRTGRTIVRALVGAMVVVTLTASPAAADPAGPSDFRSVVTGIVPAVDGVQAEIRGGDAFLELTVAPGRSATVEGYQGEPYLRFLEDGTVERNSRSAATYLNEDRRGAAEIPATAQDPGAEPEWVPVGAGGSYAWHDHRVHWMSDASPSVERGERVPGAYDPWRVPIEVDGTTAEIQGTLTYADSTSPLPWAALGIGLAALLAWAGRRRPARIGPLVLAGGSGLAVVVGRADFASTPGGGNPLLWVLPVAALATAAVALLPRLAGAATAGALASVACLSGWGLFRLQVLVKPILPTTLPFWFDRATTAGTLGLSIAAAYLAITSSQFTFAPLDDD